MHYCGRNLPYSKINDTTIEPRIGLIQNKKHMYKFSLCNIKGDRVAEHTTAQMNMLHYWNSLIVFFVVQRWKVTKYIYSSNV